MTDDHIAALPREPGPMITEVPEPERQAPDRNLALELVRVTEAGAMAAARWVGRGDKNGADGAAVHAMRMLINTAAWLTSDVTGSTIVHILADIPPKAIRGFLPILSEALPASQLTETPTSPATVVVKPISIGSIPNLSL